MAYVTDETRHDLGGNIRHGDLNTWCPTLWGYLIDRYAVSSMLDVGCGEGHAVLFFRRHNVVAHGIDGLLTNVRSAVTPVSQHDLLANPFVMPVDLVWCCEVAEHIEDEKNGPFLDTLTNGTIVAMTHAVPGQNGYHHVNCQTPDYWIGKLRERGYELSWETAHARNVASRDGPHNYFAMNGLVFQRT